MQKPIISLYVIFAFFFTASFAGAEGITSNTSVPDTSTTVNNESKTKCDQLDFINVYNETGHPDLPYLLQANQKACLDKCSQAFDTCMNGAGNSPDGKFRCEDKRRMCTLGCNNEWYPKLNL